MRFTQRALAIGLCTVAFAGCGKKELPRQTPLAENHCRESYEELSGKLRKITPQDITFPGTIELDVKVDKKGNTSIESTRTICRSIECETSRVPDLSIIYERAKEIKFPPQKKDCTILVKIH